MKALFLFSFCMLNLFTFLHAQKDTLTLKFEVDDKPININKGFDFCFQVDGCIIKPLYIGESRYIIPHTLHDTSKVDFIFTHKKHKTICSQVYMGNFLQNTNLKIAIDYPPFKSSFGKRSEVNNSSKITYLSFSCANCREIIQVFWDNNGGSNLTE